MRLMILPFFNRPCLLQVRLVCWTGVFETPKCFLMHMETKTLYWCFFHFSPVFSLLFFKPKILVFQSVVCLWFLFFFLIFILHLVWSFWHRLQTTGHLSKWLSFSWLISSLIHLCVPACVSGMLWCIFMELLPVVHHVLTTVTRLWGEKVRS